MGEMDIFTFGDLLRAYRRRAGYTQAQLAEAMGIPNRQVIIAWERGENLPGHYRDLLETLPEILGLSGDEYRDLLSATSMSLDPTQRPSNRVREHFPLPHPYVERPLLLATLRERVLAAITAGTWVALMGMAGTGKTTLLGALVRDEVVQSAFGGGIAAVTVRRAWQKQIDEMDVLWGLAQQFGEGVPVSDATSLMKLRLYLRERAAQRPVLLIVDNVEHPVALQALADIPSVVVLVALHRADMARELGISTDWHVVVDQLQADEAVALAEAISGETTPETTEAMFLQRVLDRLERHPQALRVAAGLAAKKGWEAVEMRLARADTQRRGSLGYGRSLESQNAWWSLEMIWQVLQAEDPALAHRLTLLGLTPLLRSHDVGMGEAIWQVDTQAAEDVWMALVDWQLAQEIAPGRYRLHALVWDFAAAKAQNLSWREQLQRRLWKWRYPLKRIWPGWRWYRTCVPSPWSEVKWPYTFVMPQAEGRQRVGWLNFIVRNRFWVSEDSLHLLADPVEWVVLERRAVWTRALLSLYVLLLIVLSIEVILISFADRPLPPLWVFVALGAAILASLVWAWLFAEDQRRIAGWRLLGLAFVEVSRDEP